MKSSKNLVTILMYQCSKINLPSKLNKHKKPKLDNLWTTIDRIKVRDISWRGTHLMLVTTATTGQSYVYLVCMKALTRRRTVICSGTSVQLDLDWWHSIFQVLIVSLSIHLSIWTGSCVCPQSLSLYCTLTTFQLNLACKHDISAACCFTSFHSALQPHFASLSLFCLYLQWGFFDPPELYCGLYNTSITILQHTHTHTRSLCDV